MTQLTTIFPTEQPSTCGECPFFTDHNDKARGCGWCDLFNKNSRKHHSYTNDCHLQIQSLLKQPKTIKVIALVMTTEVEDDGSGHAVPIDSRTEEITVAQPFKGLIELEIVQREEFQGYEVADVTVPDGGYEV
ncbi:MAG: hypothetical protein HC820_01735 [Hydrococcus sp. RM1_1_31]|nr:hypothetical protein [Hydrococcus sp. RM1_1_31]